MKLKYSDDALEQLLELEKDKAKQRIFKAVVKTLALMQSNLRHPSLNTHRYYGISGPSDEKIFEAYVQQNTPGAYRIFWYYGPDKDCLTILAIVPHPNH